MPVQQWQKPEYPVQKPLPRNQQRCQHILASKQHDFYLYGPQEGEHVGGDDDDAEAGAERQKPIVENNFHFRFNR